LGFQRPPPRNRVLLWRRLLHGLPRAVHDQSRILRDAWHGRSHGRGIASIHHTWPVECVEDAKSAIRWLRMNARKLGIDPGHIVAAGGSSGGTVAAFAAYNTNYEPVGAHQPGAQLPR